MNTIITGGISISVVGSRGCDRMVVGFTTTYAISAHHFYADNLSLLIGENIIFKFK
jgi:hypothetical protein